MPKRSPTPLSNRVVAALAVLAMTAGCARDGPSSSASPIRAGAPQTAFTTTATVESGALVVAAGDIACPPSMAPSEGQCQQAATAATVVSLRPDAVFALGDLQYERGDLASFKAAYAASWGQFKPITHSVPGNHEWSSPDAAGYRSYSPEAIGPGGRTYYSFDIGSWHVLALDSDCRSVGGCERGSPQEQWLRADLAAHPAACTLAFWHHPRWSSGVHGSDAGYDAFWQAIADANVEFVLVGHDHDYERFGPDRGVREFVVGTGGRSLYPVISREQRSEVHNSHSFGVLALRLGAGRYSWRFVASAGGTFTDSGSDVCR